MKYQLEMSEAETLAAMGLIERGFQTLMDEIRTARRILSQQVTDAQPAEKYEPMPSTVSLDRSVEIRPQATAATLPTPPIYEAPPIENYSPGNFIGAGSDKYNEYDFGDEYVKPYVPPKVQYPTDDGRGAKVFGEFVSEWIVGLGIEDAPQPERGDKMREIANHPKVFFVLGHVQQSGGLTRAIDKWFRTNAQHLDEKTIRAKVTLTASTMCQVSSILFPELSDLFEHRDIYKEAE